MKPEDTALAILASGEARRFGGDKLLVSLRGRPLGAHAGALAPHHDWRARLAIVPEDNPARQTLYEGLGYTLIGNPSPEAGQGQSVALAARHAAECGARALLVLLADMPFIRVETLDRLLQALGDGPAAICRHDGRTLPPALFSQDCFADLRRLSGGRGAGGLIRQLGDRVAHVEITKTEAGDIDTPNDLENALASAPDSDHSP